MPATDRPVANGLAYLAALIGVSYAFGAAVLLLLHGTALGAGTRIGRIMLVLWLIVGLAFLAAFMVLLVRRPKPGEEKQEPGWMRWIGRMGPLGVAVVGVMLVNLEMEGSARSDILAAQVTRAQAFTALALFVAVAVSTSVVPVVAYFVAPGRVGGLLARAKEWLARDDRPILMLSFWPSACFTLSRASPACWADVGRPPDRPGPPPARTVRRGGALDSEVVDPCDGGVHTAEGSES